MAASRSAWRATTRRFKAECSGRNVCSSGVHNGVPHDLIPLVEAAALAYEQVFGKRRTENLTPSADELDLVALALANHLPIYGRLADRTTEIPAVELRQGMFWSGARRFESLRGGTIVGLAVSRNALERTLSALSLDSL